MKKTCTESGSCPNCGVSSSAVKSYRTRQVLNYRVGGMETLSFQSIVFRCQNEDCVRKTFTYLPPVKGVEEVVGRSPYSRSSKEFAGYKLLKRQTSCQSFSKEVKEDYGARTSYSSLYRWAQEMKVQEVALPEEAVRVLHTDEKHPSKKRNLQ